MKIKTQNWKSIGCLLGLVFVCLAPIIFLVTNGLNYLFIAFAAFFFLAFFAITLMNQKRISIYSIMALLIGLLFLASGVIEFGYISFAQNMPIAQQTKFSSILRPDQISGALCLIGLGIFGVFLGYRQITTMSLSNKNAQVYKMIYITQISAGIYTSITGLYLVMNGLYPSAYQIHRFSDIGLIAGIICFGLLTLWYMVAQPFIISEINKATSNDKSA
jgi:uncharacterized membrane protein